jgi:hypothetical protein
VRLGPVSSACLATFSIGLASSRAHAQVFELTREPRAPRVAYEFRPRQPPIFLALGYIGSVVGGANPATGHGAEISSVFYLPDRIDPRFGFGPVLQVQNYSSPSHLRVGAGLEVAYTLLGLEILYAYRHGERADADTHGLSIGPYLSLLGVLNVAGRFTFALSPSGAPGYGNEYGVTLGLKLPILLSGDLWGTSRGPQRVPAPPPQP